MFPKEELSKVVQDIQTAMVVIGANKDKNPIVCKELVIVSLNLEKATSLINTANSMKNGPSIREETKLFLRISDTILHWAKYKVWINVCDSIDDIGSDIIRLTLDLQDILNAPKAHQKKKKVKQVTGVPDEFADEIREREEMRAQLDSLKMKAIANHAQNAENERLNPTVSIEDASGGDKLLSGLFAKMRRR